MYKKTTGLITPAIILIILFTMSMFGCNDGPEKAGTPNAPAARKNLQPTQLSIQDGRFTPEALWALGRLGDFAVSPSGNAIAYTVTYYSVEDNSSFTTLHWTNIEGTERRELLRLQAAIYNLSWQDDERIRYISTQSGTGQIYSLSAEGRNIVQHSNVEEGIDGFIFAPDNSQVAYISPVQVIKSITQRYDDLPLTSGMVYDDLMFRHWDTWDNGTRSHLFIANVTDGDLEPGIDIMQGETYNTPLPPFGGMDEIAWSPNGAYLSYTAKKLNGCDAALSTNSEIYTFNVKTRQTTNISIPNAGYDRGPLYSPDGKYILWHSMARAGFEADRERLILMELNTGRKRVLMPEWDYSPTSIHWAPDSQSLYFIAGVQGTYQLFHLALDQNEPTPITEGRHDYQSMALANQWAIASRVSMTQPAELYRIRLSDGVTAQLTDINTDLLAQIDMPKVQQRWITTTDSKRMLTWVILPPHFDSTSHYPAILYCEGGPQSSLTQFWSYRWNLALMASQGYVVVAPNRRGTLTFGQQWTDQISKDHGGQEMRDLLTAIDQLAKEPWIDENRLGAVGASYGGYTVNWLAGNHNKRFKAFISHCGIFHSEMEFYTTEELFFDMWEMGGPPWEKDNRTAQRSYAQSPHHFVNNWDTPILFIHGGKDYRIPYVQALAGFTAARLKGLDSRLLYFPDENHWVLKPQNGILWQRTFFEWLDAHLK